RPWLVPNGCEAKRLDGDHVSSRTPAQSEDEAGQAGGRSGGPCPFSGSGSSPYSGDEGGSSGEERRERGGRRLRQLARRRGSRCDRDYSGGGKDIPWRRLAMAWTGRWITASVRAERLRRRRISRSRIVTSRWLPSFCGDGPTRSSALATWSCAPAGM